MQLKTPNNACSRLGGYAPRFLSFCVALSFSRFGSESPLPSQAAIPFGYAWPTRFARGASRGTVSQAAGLGTLNKIVNGLKGGVADLFKGM